MIEKTNAPSLSAIYQIAVENFRDGIAIADLETCQTLYVNRALGEIFEISDSEILPDIYALVPEENRLRLTALHLQEGKTSLTQEFPMLTVKGTSVWVEMTATPVDFAERKAMLLIFSDISAHKRVEENLHRRAAEFAAIYTMTRAMASQSDSLLLLEEVLDHALALLSASCGEIVFYDAASDILEVKVVRGVPITPGLRINRDEGVGWKVARTMQPVIVDQYLEWEDRAAQYVHLNVAAVVGVPMLYGGDLIGVLIIFELLPSQRVFSRADVRLLELFASQAAAAVHNAQLLEETKRHLAEMQTVNRVSEALRSLQTMRQMLPCLLDETLAAFQTNAGILWVYDTLHNKLCSGVARGWFEHFFDGQEKQVIEHIGKRVLEDNQPYFIADFSTDMCIPSHLAKHVPEGWSGVCYPIPTALGYVALLFVAVRQSRGFGEFEIKLLERIARIAGDALHRARLYDRTEEQLNRISALFSIETAIGSSLDIKAILRILLDQVTTQLHVDAADILLYHPETETLEFAAGLRFRTSGLEQMLLNTHQDYAGRAIIEGRTISVPDLSQSEEGYLRNKLMQMEGFVSYYATPLISRGEEVGVLEVFHRTPLDPDPEWLEFLATMAAQAAIALDKARLIDGLQKSNRELTNAYDRTIEAWARLIDLRDHETEGHSVRVAEMAVRLARMAGVSEKSLIHVRRGAILHDIGKIAIPDGILGKKGPLSEEEWEIMRQHPVYAHKMLAPVSFLQAAIDIPYAHHEKWDGSGYPRGLKGEEIPLMARVFAVCDVWDALTSDRPYRPAWSEQKTIEYISEQSGTHFDPRIVTLFLKLMGGQE